MGFNTKSFTKLGLLGGLYMAQYVSTSFFSQALPIFLRQKGISLDAIGLLSLLTLPWMVKFIWAPTVDRYGKKSWGHYKVWIVAMQSTMVLGLIVCSFFSIERNLALLIFVLAPLYLAIATQDIATDALAIGMLDENERGLGNGIQVAGSNLGAILGGGVLVLALDRWGWQRSVLGLAVCVFLLLIPIGLHREKSASSQGRTTHWRDFLTLLWQPGMGNWLLAISMFGISLGLTVVMSRPLLVDLKWSVEAIAFLFGFAGNIISILFAILAGFLIPILGKWRSLLFSQCLVVITIALHLLPALGNANVTVIYLIVLSFQASFSMAIASIYALMMDQCRPESAGTDFSFQVSILMAAGVGIGGGISGAIASRIGYPYLFLLSLIVCFVSILLTKSCSLKSA